MSEFLFDEDAALKAHLQGIMVTDERAGAVEGATRPVRVRFGMPDPEVADQLYPYITIDMIDIQRATDREMRGMVSPKYMEPEGMLDSNGFSIQMPIPVTIDYQLTTYSRHPRHDRQIITAMLNGNAAFRFGALAVPYQHNGTTNVVFRRMDVLDFSKRDIYEDGKRLFINAVTARVSSEVAQGLLNELYKVSKVDLTNFTEIDWQGRVVDPEVVNPKPYTIS